MTSLNSKIKWLFKMVNRLIEENKTLNKQLDDTKTQPYSKTKLQPKLGNIPLVYDGNDKIWKPYAIYKDDED